MTEQEFRAALHRAAENDGLSSERQLRVLARMKGDEPKVKMKNKWMIALALVVVLSLGMTAAVAAGMAAVNWQGESAVPYNGRTFGQTEGEERLLALYASSAENLITFVKTPESQLEEMGGIMNSTCNEYAAALEEMQTWVEADGTLPWPAAIPAGYMLEMGRVGYACRADGQLELVGQYTTEDAYQVSQYRIPQEDRFMADYMLAMVNAEGATLRIAVNLNHDDSARVFNTEEDSEISRLSVQGMEDALLIVSQGETRLALRNRLAERKAYMLPGIRADGSLDAAVGYYSGMTIEVMAAGADFTAEQVLSILGLKGQ